MSGDKVLVVDDEPAILDVFERAISSTGYYVVTAETAEAAMDILKEESFMVIFLDLNLPGISGIELCKKIRKDNPVGIITAVTGFTDLFGLLECREAGFDDFLVKPIKLNVLLQAVEHAFEKLKRWQVSEYDLV